MEDSDEDLERPKASVAGPLVIGAAVATCIWLALTHPYLEFEFRIAGVAVPNGPRVLERSEPNSTCRRCNPQGHSNCFGSVVQHWLCEPLSHVLLRGHTVLGLERCVKKFGAIV